jgi:hypothetical protein
MGVNSYRAMGPFGVKVYVMLVCQSVNFHWFHCLQHSTHGGGGGGGNLTLTYLELVFWRPVVFGGVPLHMQYYMLCFRIPSTLCKFLCFQSSFLTRIKILVLLCLYKSSKLIGFTNFWNIYMCLFTSSLFVSGHLPPSIIIPFLRVSLCLFRMGHSLIKCSEFWEPVWQGHVWSSNIVNLYR